MKRREELLEIDIRYTIPIEYANIGEILDQLRESGHAEILRTGVTYEGVTDEDEEC